MGRVCFKDSCTVDRSVGGHGCYRENQHIKIDLLERFLPPLALLLCRKMTSIFSAIICGLAAYWSADLVYYEFLDSTVAFGVVPVWLCQMIMPIAFCVMGLRFLSHGWNK